MQEQIKHIISFEQGLALTLGLCEAYSNLSFYNDILDMKPLKGVIMDFGLIQAVWPEDLIADAYRFMPLEAFCLANSQEIYFSKNVYSIGLIVSRIFGSVLRTPKKFYFPRPAIERKQYIQSIQKLIKIVAGLRIRNAFFTRTIGAVVLAAKDKQYQIDNKLNKEKIEFFNLLYNMTGAEEKRSQLAFIIKKIKNIRYKMILHYRKKLAAKRSRALAHEYYVAFEALCVKREYIASDAKQSLVVDVLDAYLFKMMDSILLNRPNVEDVKAYEKELEVKYKPKEAKQKDQTLKVCTEDINYNPEAFFCSHPNLAHTEAYHLTTLITCSKP